MRQGHYQSPGRYQAPGDLAPVTYEELPLDFLSQQNAEYYGPEGGSAGLDRRLNKQLSLDRVPSHGGGGRQDYRGYPRWGQEEGVDEFGNRRLTRHSRSMSLGVEHGYGNAGPASDGFRRNQQARHPFQQPGQYGPGGRGPRFSGTSPHAGRGAATQVASSPGVGRNEGERGQGYRKLWQQVTKVGRGQKLGENSEAMPFSDMTVEDLIRIVRNLPPEESAVQAVSRGLYYLDSRALAALLKELHKLGLSNRAAELFDWLRGLPDGHELAHLCDVYTYTTIISQCGSHQQLRKALELVAEMRGRGIACNVHTYSALMNVCIKANELELALDVYKQLLQDGCQPNLVTYNILIDVHGKTGQWHDAVKVLDALEHQGTKPEVRTYNTIINACNRSGQPEFALKVYERMLADGAQPTATTYTALISAYGKTGKVEEAIQIFQDMVARNCERNVITYSSLISACEKAGRWQLALDLFQEMHRDSCKPNVVTYNALIAACGQGGQWKTAAEIFDGMLPNQCKPDAVTYGTLISAFEKGGQWGSALHAFEEMQSMGHRADVGVFNVLIEVLSRSGGQRAVAKAVQLFQTATRHGQFRMMAQNSGETSVIAFTVGAASLALLQWLQELRSRLGPNPWAAAAGTGQNPPVATPQGPPSPSAAAQPERASLLLLKGKHGRSESPPAAIEEACTALLLATGVPHAVAHTPQGVRVEVEVGGAQTWPESKDLDAVAAVLTAAATRKPPVEVMIGEDSATEARCRDAFEAVQAFEESHVVGSKALSEEDLGARRETVGMLVTVARNMGLSEEAVHDAVQLLDRLLRHGLGARNMAANPALLAAVASLAAQQGAAEHGQVESAAESVVGCSTAQLAELQDNVFTLLDRDKSAISAYRVLHLYLERLGVDFQEPALAGRVAGDVLHLIDDAIFEPSLMDIPPSLLAAAVLYHARKKAGTAPFWPQALADLTGYTDPAAVDLGAAVEAAGCLVPGPGTTAQLLLVPSPVPTATSTPMGVLSPPLSQASTGSISNFGALLSPGMRRTSSGSQGLGGAHRQGSGLLLQATLSGPPSLALSEGLSIASLPRTPSLPPTASFSAGPLL